MGIFYPTQFWDPSFAVAVGKQVEYHRTPACPAAPATVKNNKAGNLAYAKMYDCPSKGSGEKIKKETFYLHILKHEKPQKKQHIRADEKKGGLSSYMFFTFGISPGPLGSV